MSVGGTQLNSLEQQSIWLLLRSIFCDGRNPVSPCFSGGQRAIGLQDQCGSAGLAFAGVADGACIPIVGWDLAACAFLVGRRGLEAGAGRCWQIQDSLFFSAREGKE